MNDLAEFTGDMPMRAKHVKLRTKAQERLDRLTEKAEPILAEIAMHNEIIAAIDRRVGIQSINKG